MQPIPCGHCQRPRCRLCWLYENDAAYRKLWGGGGEEGGGGVAVSAPARSSVARAREARVGKPRIGVQELAEKRKRCAQAKAEGRPCTEFGPGGVGGEGAAWAVGAGRWVAPEVVDGVAILRTDEEEGGLMGHKNRPITWAYGVTTVPSRRGTLLPRTLASLKGAGFGEPVLFVDGCDHHGAVSYEREFHLPVVNRWPTIRVFGNWVLSMAELYIRNPLMDRFALFQDDLVCSKNLRDYLDACPYPDGKGENLRRYQGKKGYWNLYTFDLNHRLAPREAHNARVPQVGWYPSNQRGLGAVGLVFNRESLWNLLTEKGHIVTRPAHAGDKAWCAVDGGIVDAMRKQGYTEFVHAPSLIQHTGHKSSFSKNRHPDAKSFRGEDFDLLELVPRK